MRRTLLALVTAVAAATALLAAPPPAVRAAPAAPTAEATAADVRAPVPVSMVAYHLGNRAFRDPDVTEYDGQGRVVPMELTAAVYYPTRLGSEKHPLVVLEHGSWFTCVDKARRKVSATWPCPKPTVPLRSYRGYDYLARDLAAQGFVVVSISANAINARVLGDVGYLARARLVNKHLQLWKTLVDGRGGRLRGQFVDPRTREQVRPVFKGRVDMQRVGTLGHSRGGKGVMWQAADKHRSEWPEGVRVRGVVGLAPVYFTPPGETNRNTRVTKVPFLVVTGSCDGTVGGDQPGVDYLRDVRGLNPDASAVSITGANHNFFNTRWSPGAIGGTGDGDPECPGRIGQVEQRERTTEVVVPWFVDHLLG